MYYVHYDNFGRPDSFSGFKSTSKQKAIDYCNSLNQKAYVSQLTKGKSAWNNEIVEMFKPYCYCNKLNTSV